MAESADPFTSTNIKNPSLCDECHSNPWKYRCPGCSIRSCSLPCVNSHKKRTSCTGRRSHAESLPLSQFDDNLLLADYRLLEETKRVADSARRMIVRYRSYFGSKLPPKLWALRKAARCRRIQLLFFPGGMLKRETNQSRFDRRKNTIFWTVELRFHGTGAVLVHHGVDEHSSLSSMLERLLMPGPWIHKLRSFCDAKSEDLKLFVRKNPKGSKSQFRKLDIKASMGSQLSGIMIIEHPVIFVYLPSHDLDFEVEVSRLPLLQKPPASTFEADPNRIGCSYRVEEIEEGNDMCLDTRITDTRDVPEASNVMEMVESYNAAQATPGDFGHRLSGEALSSPELGDAEFCFEQELRDAYSDLIGEMNPDDFLCLDGMHEDSVDLSGARWHGADEVRKVDDDFNETLVNELEGSNCDMGGMKGEKSFLACGISSYGELELEEGEIPCFL